MRNERRQILMATIAAACAMTTTAALAQTSKPADPDWADSMPTAKFQPLTYNNPGLLVDLGVGLWASPVPMPATDGKGVGDLVVICTGRPHNGVYRFAATGQSHGGLPVFAPPERLGSAKSNSFASYVDGKPVILRPGESYASFDRGLRAPTTLPAKTESFYDVENARVRQNAWRYVDFDGDGVNDLVVGIEDWKPYGWDDAFDASGKWTNGPLAGSVFILRNAGTNDAPNYETAKRLEAGGKPIDVFGMPTPSFADYDGDGDLDLVCGDFVGDLTYFENTGSRTAPTYAAGRKLAGANGAATRIPAPMIVPTPFDVNGDGKPDLAVGGEDGRVYVLLNEGDATFAAPRPLQQRADALKFGVLCDPVPFDWDGDGDLDLIVGNGAGEVGFFENLSGPNVDAPKVKWPAPKLLDAGGETIRIVAGANGSVQGPAEERWGYTTLSVADWDADGLPDIVVNSIWGRVVWFKNVGTRTAPKLAAAQPIEVAWPDGGEPYKPDWIWWTPKGRELVTQWRTTPMAVDVNGDGLVDLAMLDRDGFLSLFERRKKDDGALELLPPRHVFRTASTKAKADAKSVVFKHSQPIVGRGESTEQAVDRSNDPAYAGDAVGEGVPLRMTDGWAGRSGRRKLWLVDIDGDGDLDLLANSKNATLYRNVATRKGEFLFREEGPIDTANLTGHDTSPAAGDFDGDGVPDVVIGAEDGFIYFMKNPGRGASARR